MAVRPSACARLVAAVAVFVVSLLYVTPALAQAQFSIINEKSLPRVDAEGNQLSKRDPTLNPEGVSFQDCVDDQRIRFTMNVSGFVAQSSIQVWASAGPDCSDALQRSGATQQCWRVIDGDIPLQINVNVDIPVRTIMSGAPPFTAAAPDTTASACGRVNLTTISVQFLYFAPGNVTKADSKKDVTIQVDTVGPDAPTGINSLPGDGRIQVSWDNISGEGGVTALTGVRIYCDPAQAGTTTVTTEPTCEDVVVPVEAGPAVDAGDDADADASATGTADAGTTTVRVCTDGGTETVPGSECASPNFVTTGDGGESRGVIPDADFDAKYKCGEVRGNTGASATADGIGQGDDKVPLANGTRYAVAVAATDAFGNVGALSTAFCQTPAETTDFWDGYREAGGKAGGGCATSGPSAPTGSIAAFGLVLVATLSSLRKKQKDRR
jgi:MYXO-CTERM domain-containing protein